MSGPSCEVPPVPNPQNETNAPQSNAALDELDRVGDAAENIGEAEDVARALGLGNLEIPGLDCLLVYDKLSDFINNPTGKSFIDLLNALATSLSPELSMWTFHSLMDRS